MPVFIQATPTLLLICSIHVCRKEKLADKSLTAGMWAPGIVGVVIGLFLLVAVKDSPEKIGYPPVEIVKPNKVQSKAMAAFCASAVPLLKAGPNLLPSIGMCMCVQVCVGGVGGLTCLLLVQKKDSAGVEQKESLLQLLVQNVLKNPYIWGMALTYFFIYVVRQGVTSWFVFYLMKVRCCC